jgi:uncharacterized protein (TIGR03083 family)
MGTWEQIDAERTELGELADSLTPDQWEKPSLCTAWKVRDVVAHVNQGARLTTGAAIGLTVKHGFRIDTMLRKEAVKEGAAPTDELRKGIRESVGKRTTPPGAKPDDMLADLVIHQQDIRRALGTPRTIPADTLRKLLDRMAGSKTFLRGDKRAGGLTLRATDLDWQHGEGPEVSGPGEAILMAISGRPAAVAELSGPGLATLKERIDG